MVYFEAALLVLGIVLLVVGYRKNSRNLLLAGAIVLLFSAGAEQIVEGWKDGASSEGRDAVESAAE